MLDAERHLVAPLRPAYNSGVPVVDGAVPGVAAAGGAAAEGSARVVVEIDAKDDDAAAADELHPSEEARAARPARDPGAPTAAMIKAYAATHLPYRS